MFELTDVRGFIARFSRSSKSCLSPSPSGHYDDDDPEVVHTINSFLSEEQLRQVKSRPRGKASVEYTGMARDGALNLNFSYDSDAEESEDMGREPHLEDTMGAPRASAHEAALPNATSLTRQGGRVAQNVEGDSAEAVRPAVPPLSICIMISGTRGDVQPFVALGNKLQEYGHRVRLATHKDYRKFVTDNGLEFYPLGGDPKILSDFIVKYRGVFPTSAKDAMENIRQVEAIVMTTYAACTEPDMEGDKKPFTAQAIIANPVAYGHIHCAEKLKIPLHIFFTMPWSPTRQFPHPLARMQNVRDTRPSSIALRNYLSYIVVNEFTYTGLFPSFNRFRRDVLHLPPLRLGNRGPYLLSSHEVPFGYCWSPSLVPKPSDWEDYIDVTGYFFLNEGQKGRYHPPKELVDFLAAGPAPVYIGFGSLIMDDAKEMTQIILDAVQRSGQRLLLSKGWGQLGVGCDLPDTVLLLDDCPHDWLFPQCCAVVHHGGAGTTAAGLINACPTTVIPFFGDQTFWGSAVYRRGVGPRPIPVDRLTTAKLAAALEFMKKPEVKEQAEVIAELIKQEDGVTRGMEVFHRHLPVEKLIAGEPVEWNLAKPSMYNFFSETGGGIADLFVLPYSGAKVDGVKGALKGMGKGLASASYRPFYGLYLSGASVAHQVQELGSGVMDKLSTVDEGHEGESVGSPRSLSGGMHSFKRMFHRKSSSLGADSVASLPYGDHDLNLDEDAGEENEEALSASLQAHKPFKRTFSFRMVPAPEEAKLEEPQSGVTPKDSLGAEAP